MVRLSSLMNHQIQRKDILPRFKISLNNHSWVYFFSTLTISIFFLPLSDAQSRSFRASILQVLLLLCFDIPDRNKRVINQTSAESEDLHRGPWGPGLRMNSIKLQRQQIKEGNLILSRANILLLLEGLLQPGILISCLNHLSSVISMRRSND